MKNLTTKRGLRCAIYTRVSTDQGLERDFNSLDAQREASEAYIKSQAARVARPAAACSAGGTSTNSCRSRSMSAASPIKAKSTKASIRRSSIRICETTGRAEWSA